MKYTLRANLSEEEREELRLKDRVYYDKTRKHSESYKKSREDYWQKRYKELYRINRKSVLKRKYGIDWTIYETMFEEQEGLCAICRKDSADGRMLAVDHDHKTGKVRALLCGSCNRGLGLFQDDPDLLQKAKEYVS